MKKAGKTFNKNRARKLRQAGCTVTAQHLFGHGNPIPIPGRKPEWLWSRD